MSSGEFRGTELVFKFMEGMRQEAKIAAGYAVGAMAAKGAAYCKQMITLGDHSLEDLARMGHPYSQRHPANPHDPPESIHSQSGAHAAALHAPPPALTADGATAKVVNDDPKDVWLQVGTQSMIARPYMKRVREAYAEPIVQAGASVMQERLEKRIA